MPSSGSRARGIRYIVDRNSNTSSNTCHLYYRYIYIYIFTRSLRFNQFIECLVQMEDSNEEKLFSAYLDENDAYREERVTSVSPRLLDKSNVSTHRNEHKTDEKISSPKDYRSIVYPTKLIKPNFIVDLMDIPGDLIPIGSLRSKLYCTRKMTHNKICCH